MAIKMSVVIPVYNVLSYLPKCVESVLTDSGHDTEIILVNDGSTDGSGELCDKYAENNKCVMVIHQKNQGSVAARNAGIQNAKGDYIAFGDSDDWVSSHYLTEAKKIFAANSDVDVVISTMVHNINEQEDLKIFPKKWNQKMANVTAACEMFERNYFGWELAGKVYKKGVLLELSLDKTVTDAEDLDANWQILSKARNVYCCSDMIYHYRLHPSSKIHSNNLRAGYESMFKVAQHLMSNIWTNDSRVADKLFRFYMRCAYNVGREEVFNGDNLYLLKKMKNDVRQCMSEFAIDDIKEMEFMKLWAIDEHLFYEKINTVLHKIEEKFKNVNCKSKLNIFLIKKYYQ